MQKKTYETHAKQFIGMCEKTYRKSKNQKPPARNCDADAPEPQGIKGLCALCCFLFDKSFLAVFIFNNRRKTFIKHQKT